MKKIAILYILLIFGFKTLAQSVELSPGSNGFVMIPNVSTLGSCLVADKGKIVYYSTDNTLRMCNGTSWQDISSLSVPFVANDNLDNSFIKLSNAHTNTSAPVLEASYYSNFSGSAITGNSGAQSPVTTTYGIKGINKSGNDKGIGVYGEHFGAGTGVYGKAKFGTGVQGISESGAGLVGNGRTGVNGAGVDFGVTGSSPNGIAGYFTSTSGKALITAQGKVGIGIETPNELLDVNGRVRIRHNPGYSAGIWMSNSTNGLGNGDGSFFGNKTDTEAGIYIGNNWQFWVDNSGQISSSALAGTGTRPVLTNSSGTLIADNVNHSLVLSPADFQPVFSVNQFSTNTSWVYFTDTGGLYSAIHLPGGAVITDISIVGKDNSSTARLCLYISKSEATSDNSLYYGCSSLAGFSSELTNLSLSPSITPFVIEEDEFYQVYVSAQNNSGLNVSWNSGNNFQFRSVKITYHY